MPSTRLAAVLVLVVLAGCGGFADPSSSVPASSTDRPASSSQSPTATPSSSATSSPSPASTPSPTSSAAPESIADGPAVLRTGSLPVDEDRVYRRVANLLGAYPEPTTVSVLPLEETDRQRCVHTDFFERMGAPCEFEGEPPAVTGFVAPGSSGVTLHVGENASATAVESVLAHEFAHAVQTDRGVTFRSLGPVRTTDGLIVQRMLVEGHAQYLQRTYDRRYLGVGSAAARERYLGLRGYEQAGVYYFGSRYVERRSDSPSGSWTAFSSPPNTTEQVLHEDAAGEPPASLDVRTEVNGTWRAERRDTLGELATRNLLRSAVDERRAGTAAAGWGDDRLVVFRGPDGGTAYVWVTRWDDAENATEFASAARAYLNRTADPDGGPADTGEGTVWRRSGTVYRLSAEGDATVVLTAGPPGFAVERRVAADGTVTLATIRDGGDA